MITLLDWLVLLGTLFAIVGYGTWKTSHSKDISGYLKGGNEMKWYTVGLSIMATQASAITFLSTPGQAYESGMGFVQFYFGLPIAMVIISAFFLPMYYRLKVFTAYEYLENRFDLRVRLFTAFLFLVSRGLAAGITIYAPAIILSTLLGWNLEYMNILVGLLVIIYTVSGGTRAVSLTQKYQMAVIMGGMIIAFFLIIDQLPPELGFGNALELAGSLGRMNLIDTNYDLENRYTLLSGLTGGLFLALSYFGTDQSQVQRYLGGQSLKESRLGLMFNGIFKVPMQFFILLVGVMVFVFFQFNRPPAFFNGPGRDKVLETQHALEYLDLEDDFNRNFEAKRMTIVEYTKSDDLRVRAALKEKAQSLQRRQEEIRSDIRALIDDKVPDVETKDSDYIFLTFVLQYLPHGIIGLLLAVILSASMSSTAGELNALASTTMVDFYRRLNGKSLTDKQEVVASKWLTFLWGVMSIGVALSASLVDNLIQLVNILGSLFYGTILGIFLLAFFFKKVGAREALVAGVIGETAVLVCHLLNVYEVINLGFLWYNLIGCGTVVLIALLIASMRGPTKESPVLTSS